MASSFPDFCSCVEHFVSPLLLAKDHQFKVDNGYCSCFVASIYICNIIPEGLYRLPCSCVDFCFDCHKGKANTVFLPIIAAFISRLLLMLWILCWLCCWPRIVYCYYCYTENLKANGNAHVYSPDTSVSSTDYPIYTLVLEHILLQSHFLWGEFNICTFCQSLQVSFLRSTRCPSLLGKQRQYGMASLPDTFAHSQQWESHPKPFDLESNALSTRPHTPQSYMVTI